MKKKISKKLLILIVSVSLLVTSGIVVACAGGDEFWDFFNSFFAPETSNATESKPLYRSLRTFYGESYFDDAIHVMDSANITEWNSFFSGKVKPDDLKYIIYKSRIGEIDTCIFYIKNNAYPIESYLKNNSLLAYSDKTTAKEFLFYLGYAKRCEPFSTYNPGWWNDDEVDPRADQVPIESLLAGGKKMMANAKTAFMKERYAFQIARLLFQSGAYEECIAFFDEKNSFFKLKNTSYYRSMGYAAASHYKLNEYSEANYLYSVLYDRCKPMKIVSYMSFHPQEESDWEGAFELTQNTREKEALWHMLGIYADPVRAMKEIYSLNPGSDLLDLLLVRAVNINEEAFIRHQDYWSDNNKGYSLKIENVDDDLLTFSERVAEDGTANKPYLWNLVAGYLNLVKGDYKKSEQYLSAAGKLSSEDVLVNEQIHAFRIISMVEQYNKPDARKENFFTAELNWLIDNKRNESLRSSCIYNWTLSRLSEKYFSWGDSVKAQCLDYNQNKSFYKYPANIEAMIALMDKPSKTDFEKYILAVHPYSKPTLITYKAILLIYQYKFREALEMIDSDPEAGNGMLWADPFVIHINDCHDCDFNAEKENEYSQYSFVERLLELQKEAVDDPANAAEYYFLLANGLYNMTYYGNAHDVFASPLIDLSVGYFYFDYNSTEELYQYFDCSKAMEYYRKAMDASSDPEFRAKCCFMAAKCEQNQYFSSPEFEYDAIIRSGRYYKQMVDEYKNTEYYSEVINECGYFRFYAESQNIQ